MPDNRNRPGDPEDQEIDVTQDKEVAMWAKKLGVTNDRVRQAVHSVGKKLKDVRRFLEG